MTFKVSDQHFKEYHENGFTVFRNLIPASLLTDLRVMADEGLKLVHEIWGPQFQRLQPIVKHIDCTAYFELLDLPELNQAAEYILGDQVSVGRPPNGDDPSCGILYNPKNQPYCTQWHRDWRDNHAGLDIDIWRERQLDWKLFNQVNCALYDDSCTWVVPGSHLRDDTQAEIKRFPMRPIEVPNHAPEMSNEEMEIQCLAYTQSMPGAYNAHLYAGDYMLYRNSLWHIGNYTPYRKRATIHDGFWTEEFWQWKLNSPKNGTDELSNPHKDTAAYKEWAAAQAS
ncbi:MAG: phytanoyl-CoA dioxygenase family protein [Planctomycetes bacterium]|nr:phytanoyl-CoA dioxygenase family protein [Planctomycetota bacterium]